jgi:hypothetical protein
LPALAVAGAAALVIVAGAAAIAAGAGSPSPARSQAGASPASTVPAGSAGRGSPGPAPHAQAPYAGVPAGHVTALPAGALPAGPGRVVTLVVLTGAPSVSVRVAPLDGELLEAATAPGYGARPVAAVNQAAGDGRSAGVIGLSLDPAGAQPGTGPAGGARASLSVTLSADVTWQLDFGGGTTQMTADLTGGHVAGLDFGQGTSQARVTLPRPDGTTVVRLDGGAGLLAVAVPDGVPARVTAGAGAGQVLLGGQSYTGIAGGTVLAQPGWAGAASRVDVDVTAGASQISVTAA